MPLVRAPDGKIYRLADGLSPEDMKRKIEVATPGTYPDFRYDDPLTSIGKAVSNLVPQGEIAALGGRAATAEIARSFLDPTMDYTVDEQGRVTHDYTPTTLKPGAPIEEYLAQPASKTMEGWTPASLVMSEEQRKNAARQLAKSELADLLKARQPSKEIKPRNVAPGDWVGETIYNVASAVPDTLISLGAGLAAPATRGASVGMLNTYFALKGGGQTYIDAREKGLPPSTALFAAGINGASEVVTEAIAGKVFGEGGGKTLLGTFLKTGGTEVLTEEANTAINLLVSTQVLREDMTLDQVVDQLRETALTAGLTGGGVGAALHVAANVGVPKPNETPDTGPSVVELELNQPSPATNGVSNAAVTPSQAEAATPPKPLAIETDTRLALPPPSTLEDTVASVVTPPPPGETMREKNAAKTATLLAAAREVTTPVGGFSVAEVGPDVAGKVNLWRARTGRNIDAPITVDDMRAAKVETPVIDELVAIRKPVTSLGIGPSAQQAGPVAAAVNADLQDQRYQAAVNGVRAAGRFTIQTVKDALGTKSMAEARAVRDQMVQRGDLIETKPGKFKIYEQPKTEAAKASPLQTHTVAPIASDVVAVKKDGKVHGTYETQKEAAAAVRAIRARENETGTMPGKVEVVSGGVDAEGKAIAGRPAFAVYENQYDEAGNLMGRSVVSTHATEESAASAAKGLQTKPVVARAKVAAPVQPERAVQSPAAPIMQVPEVIAGREQEIINGLDKLAKQRGLPTLGVKVKLVHSIVDPTTGQTAEGAYLNGVVRLALDKFNKDMSVDDIIEGLAAVMDHELIHGLSESGVLAQNTPAFRILVDYVTKAKHPNTGLTFWQTAQLPPEQGGYADMSPGVQLEEAMAEAFRYWAANRRAVTGAPGTVFNQIVRWFKNLVTSIPNDMFRAIETGSLVRATIKPPASKRLDAVEKANKARDDMRAATTPAEKIEAQREFLQAREQAADDRVGRVGPRTVLGTTPSDEFLVGSRAAFDTVDTLNNKVNEKLKLSPTPNFGSPDTDFMRRLADAYDSAKHQPSDIAVQKAYTSLSSEVRSIFDALDLKVTPWRKDGQAYLTQREMMDAIGNGEVNLRLSNEMFPPHPTRRNHPMQDASGVLATDGTMLSNGDLLRVVAEVYGYAPIGVVSNNLGDYRAYHTLKSMFSDRANKALATEMLAQSAWHNYGPKMRLDDGSIAPDGALGYVPPVGREFAEQKATVLPDAVLVEPAAAAEEPIDLSGIMGETRYSRGVNPQVNTPEFKAWFKNSKVVDENGNPLVLYHGTNAKFTVFNPSVNGVFGPGIYATVYDGDALTYGKIAMPVYISIQNPLRMNASDFRRLKKEGIDLAEWQREQIAAGYDGIINNDMSVVVAFGPTQIKSATGNIGTFDPTNPDIRYSRGVNPQVNTPEFKAWFKNSKVVDENGNPLVIYHGTPEKNLTQFDPKRIGSRDSGFYGTGFYLTPDRETAYEYSSDEEGLVGQVLPVYASLQKPFVWDGRTLEARAKTAEALSAMGVKRNADDITGSDSDALSNADERRRFNAAARAAGYDGVIVYSQFGDGSPREIVAFQPTQIKSATGNIGTFDPTNPDIRYSRGVKYGPAEQSRLPSRGPVDTSKTYNVGSPEFYQALDEVLPGGKHYGKADRAAAAVVMPVDTSAPAFSRDYDGNVFFGGDFAYQQLQMARDGDRGAVLTYMAPEDFLRLADQQPMREQRLYDAAAGAGYKFNTMPSLVVESGKTGAVPVLNSDGVAIARALIGKAQSIPVVLYPSANGQIENISTLEANGNVVQASEMNEFDIERRGPRHGLSSVAFNAWFKQSAVVDENGAPKRVYHSTREDFGIFDTTRSEFGSHFGTIEQAQTLRGGVNNGTVYPTYLSIQNPLRLTDRASFSNTSVAEQLRDLGIIDQETYDGVMDNSVNGRVALQDAIVDAGYDGIVYVNRAEGIDLTTDFPGMSFLTKSGDAEFKAKYPEAQDSYIVFQPTQVKSAIANRGTWSSADPDIRYSRSRARARVTPHGGLVYSAVHDRVDGSLGQFFRNLGRSKAGVRVGENRFSIFDYRIATQDSFLEVKDIYGKLAKNGIVVPSEIHAYVVEQSIGSTAAFQIKEREKNFVQPLVEAIGDGIRAKRFTYGEMQDFLYALHAPERNAYLRARGSKSANPSGMSEAEAAKIVADAKAKGIFVELMGISRKVEDIVTDINMTRVRTGQITPSVLASSPFRNWVPLRDTDDVDPFDEISKAPRADGVGRSFTSWGKRPDKRMFGRTSKAGDIVANLISLQAVTVMRGERARVGKALIDTLTTLPNAKDILRDDLEIIAKAPTKLAYGADGMIREIVDPNYRNNPDIVVFKVDGKEVMLRSGNPRLVAALKGPLVEQMGPILQLVSQAARFRASIITSRDPAFVLTNLSRDAIEAMINAGQYGIPGLAAKVIANIPRSAAAVAQYQLGKGETKGGEYREYYREMEENGWIVSFLAPQDIKRIMQKVQRDAGVLTGTRGAVAKAGKAFDGFMEAWDGVNNVTEGGLRLAFYAEMRKAGASITDAGIAAKNLTINFNKGGTLKPLMNANYLFSSVVMNSVATTGRMLTNKRGRRVLTGVIALGFLLDALNRALSDDDDDNGIKDYDQLTEDELNRNLIFPTRYLWGQDLKLPVAVGPVGALFNMGRNLSRAVDGITNKRQPVSPVASILNAVTSTVDALNPVGDSNRPANLLAPWYLDPVIDLYANRNWADMNIVPQTFDNTKPDSQKYYRTTDDIYINTAQGLNALTGGNESRKGWFDFSPEQYKYVSDFLTGGTGRFFLDSAYAMGDARELWSEGRTDLIQTGRIPILKRFVPTTAVERGGSDIFYKLKGEVQTTENELKSDNPETRAAGRTRVAAKGSVMGAFNQAEAQLKALRMQLTAAQQNKTMTSTARLAKIEEIKNKMQDVMDKAVKRYYDALEKMP